jgi:hypothetical protein
MIDLFERRFSVDETVRRHKPAQEAYHSVAAALDLDPGGGESDGGQADAFHHRAGHRVFPHRGVDGRG